MLLTGPRASHWRTTAEGLPMTVHTVEAPDFTRLYGVSAEGAVLVRPDGHIAWRARSGVADERLEDVHRTSTLQELHR